MEAAAFKMLADSTAKIVREHFKSLAGRVKQIEGQGAAINENFAAINERLSAIEDMLTDPGAAR